MTMYYRARLYALPREDEEHYITDFLVAHLIDIDKIVDKSDIESLQKGDGIYFDVTKE